MRVAEVNVDVVINRMDLINLQFYVLRTSKVALFRFAFLFVAILVFIAYKDNFNFTVLDACLAVLAALIGAVCAMAFSVLWNMAYIFSFAGRAAGVLGKHEYEILKEGFRESSSAHDGVTAWGGIKEVISLDKYVLVSIGSSTFHVIPKRHFIASGDAEKFVNLIEENLKKVAC